MRGAQADDIAVTCYMAFMYAALHPWGRTGDSCLLWGGDARHGLPETTNNSDTVERFYVPLRPSLVAVDISALPQMMQELAQSENVRTACIPDVI
jgi:hypothetical protein